MTQMTEWVGYIQSAAGVLSILAALLLAMNNRWSGYGFVLYLAANALWAIFGVATSAEVLLMQQVLIAIISLLGIWRWLIKPRLDAYRLRLWEQWMGGHV